MKSSIAKINPLEILFLRKFEQCDKTWICRHTDTYCVIPAYIFDPKQNDNHKKLSFYTNVIFLSLTANPSCTIESGSDVRLYLLSIFSGGKRNEEGEEKFGFRHVKISMPRGHCRHEQTCRWGIPVLSQLRGL